MVMKIETASHAGLTLLPWPCLESQEESAILFDLVQYEPRLYNRVACLTLEEIRTRFDMTRLETSIRCYVLLDGKQ